MTEIAPKINASAPAPAKPAKPFRTYPVGQIHQSKTAATSFATILLPAVLSLIGVLVMLASGGMGRWQSLPGSPESWISFVFLAQVAAAVLCFAFLIRWMLS